jgi:predicted enzyme related to lactoylglutathione lyase
MKVKEIGFVGIPVTDIGRAREFYEGVLGLEESGQFMEGRWVEYGVGDNTIAIASIGSDWVPSDQGTGVALEMEDFDEAIRELHAKGVNFVFDAMESPVCHMAIVQDPDGNKVVIHKQKAAE